MVGLTDPDISHFHQFLFSHQDRQAGGVLMIELLNVSLIFNRIESVAIDAHHILPP
jgi:hypothetical protein